MPRREIFDIGSTRIEIREEQTPVRVRNSGTEMMREVARGRLAMPYREEREATWRILVNGRCAGIAKKSLNGRWFTCGRYREETTRALALRLCGLKEQD